MNKNHHTFKVENNLIKIFRFAVKYTNEVCSTGLLRKSEITQFLVSNEELNALVTPLKNKEIPYEVIELDITPYEQFDSVSVTSEEEAYKIIFPNIEELKVRLTTKVNTLITQFKSNGFKLKVGKTNKQISLDEITQTEIFEAYMLKSSKASRKEELEVSDTKNKKVSISEEKIEELYETMDSTRKAIKEVSNTLLTEIEEETNVDKLRVLEATLTSQNIEDKITSKMEEPKKEVKATRTKKVTVSSKG